MADIEVHLTVDSSAVAHWAASHLLLAGMGLDPKSPDDIERLMAANKTFCRRMVSIYLAARELPAAAEPPRRI